MAVVTPQHHSPDSASSARSGNAFAVAAMLFWATGFPAAEILLEHWHPTALMTLRLMMAMAVLLPVWALADGVAAMASADWRRGIWIGALGFGAGTNLLLFAQWYTDPVTVALIAATTPIAATTIELLYRVRHMTLRFLAGLLFSVMGGTIAVGGNLSPDIGWGVLMAVGSGFSFAWASFVTVREFPQLSPIGRSTITFAGAAIFTALVFSITWSTGLVDAPAITSTKQIGLLAIYSIAAMALSQVLFITSVGRIGVALTSFHINVAPFYVMIIMVALGGAWNWRAAIGAAVVGLGVFVAQSRRKT